MTLARPSKRRRLATVMALAALAVMLVATPPPAAAATPPCSAVLFVPVDEAGAYMVEQPESAPGAIFCGPSLGSLEFSLAEAPEHGAVSALEPNGLGGASFDYTPAPGFAGADSFALSVREGEGEPVSVRVDVSVRLAVNDPPVCSAQLLAGSDGTAYTVESGATVTGSIDCFDDEGAELDFAVQSGPAHGTLGSIKSEGPAAGSFTYTPSPGYQGSDEFALVADDGTQNSAPVVVEVAVTAVVNDPPACAATLATTSDASGDFEIEQGETVHGTVTCVDEEGDALGFGLAVQPKHGVVSPFSPSGDGAEIAYTPAPGYLGFDSFRVDVSDGVNPAVPVTVRVQVVAARNDPPTCTAQLLAPVVNGAYRVSQGAAVEGQLDCEDDEGAPLDYAVATPPQHGSLTPIGEDGHFSYTAPASFVGTEEIALLANDGTQDSQPVVLEIAVAAAQDEPPACEVTLGAGTNAGDEYLIERDTTAQGRIVCSDDAAAELGLTVAAAPAHGSIGAFERDGPMSATFSYTPASGYTGPDAFGFAASDGVTAPQATAVAVQVVEPSPHVPHCRARLQTPSSESGYEVESGETVSGTLTCFDADGDELSFSVARAPGHGSIAGLEPAADGVGRFTYAADAGWTGPDSFALVASDGLHSSDVVEVDAVVVPPVNDPPVCTVSLFSERMPSGAYPAEEGEGNPGVVVCEDDEGEPLTFSVVEGPQHGVITGLQSEGESAFFDYRADAGYLGPDAVKLSASDPVGGEDLLMLELEVGPAVNTAPSCTATLNAPLVGGSYQVVAGTSTAGEITCADAELDPLTFSIVQSPSRGALSALAGAGDSRSFTYTVASGQSGPDHFSFKANDGRTDSAAVVVALQIEPPSVTAPGGEGPASTSTPVSTPPTPSAPSKPKPKKCRKGFKIKKVHGKVKCVKKHKKHKGKKHGG